MHPPIFWIVVTHKHKPSSDNSIRFNICFFSHSMVLLYIKRIQFIFTQYACIASVCIYCLRFSFFFRFRLCGSFMSAAAIKQWWLHDFCCCVVVISFSIIPSSPVASRRFLLKIAHFYLNRLCFCFQCIAYTIHPEIKSYDFLLRLI